MNEYIKNFEKYILDSKGYQEFQKIKAIYKDNYESINELFSPTGHINIYGDSIVYTEYIERYMPAGMDTLEYEASLDFPKKFKHDMYLVSYITRKGYNSDISWDTEYTLIDYEGKLYKARSATLFNKKDVKKLVNIRKSSKTTKE